MVLMEESASMFCARVMRGINSTEKEVTPVAAIASTVCTSPSGRRNPISDWPFWIQRQIGLAGFVVGAVTEHLQHDVRGAKDSRHGRT